MNRREFMKTGTMAFSLTAAGGWAFDFTPDDDFGNEYHHCLPFRKEPRNVKEEVAGFLWADAADFQSYGGWALDTQHVGFMGSPTCWRTAPVAPSRMPPSSSRTSRAASTACGCAVETGCRSMHPGPSG